MVSSEHHLARGISCHPQTLTFESCLRTVQGVLDLSSILNEREVGRKLFILHLVVLENLDCLLCSHILEHLIGIASKIELLGRD